MGYSPCPLLESLYDGDKWSKGSQGTLVVAVLTHSLAYGRRLCVRHCSVTSALLFASEIMKWTGVPAAKKKIKKK